jgi:beta-mannosidase
LYDEGVIGDPYYGLNDFNLRWVNQQNWTYSALLDVTKYGESSYLVFHGLDTFATIELCGKHVASTNNQFRQYYFDVTEILRTCTGDVSLSMNFGSAAEIARQIANKPGQNCKIPLLYLGLGLGCIAND